MNILIFSTFHQPASFTGLNMEIIQQNLDKGNYVHYIDCNGSFDLCGFNTYKLKYMCELCKYREGQGLQLINGKYNRSSISDLINDNDRETAQKFISGSNNIDKKLTHENFKIGESVFSSMISKTRNREFLDDSTSTIITELTENSFLIYESLKRFIKDNSIDKLYLFNGRWEYYRAALAAANSLDIEVEVFELYRKGGFYQVFGNNLPHNIKRNLLNIENHWNSNVDNNYKKKIADEFFVNKRKGLALIDRSYTNDQIKGNLPAKYDKTKKTFVLYNSSDDEFAAVGEEYDNPLFKDQLEGILYLINFFNGKKDYQLIIRMHPNLKGLIRSYLTPLYELQGKYENVILIKPEDSIDSYELMNVADTVISFGSTAGIEASYWGKPVILLGKAVYYYSNVAYVPNSKEQIEHYLNTDLEPHEKINAQKFAFYYSTGGVKAEYFHSYSDGKITFKGVNLSNLNSWFKFYYKILKFLKIRN
jgi:capsule polysaccharide modification protein KpsS